MRPLAFAPEYTKRSLTRTHTLYPGVTHTREASDETIPASATSTSTNDMSTSAFLDPLRMMPLLRRDHETSPWIRRLLSYRFLPTDPPFRLSRWAKCVLVGDAKHPSHEGCSEMG